MTRPRIFDHKRALRLHALGKSNTEVAEAVGCAPKTISQLLRQKGLSKPQKRVDHGEVLRLSAQGLRVSEIARQLNISVGTASKTVNGKVYYEKIAKAAELDADFEPERVYDRDPCFKCGVRGDVGCGHRA